MERIGKMTQENQGNQDGQQQDQGQQQGQETQQQNQDQDKDKSNEAKFTQDDLNKFAAKIRAEEKAKADKIQADLKRQQELAAMQETDRLKAEKEDAEKKLQELQKQMEFSKQKTETLSGLAEAKLDSRFIDVLMSDKPNSDKIKLIADIQKELSGYDTEKLSVAQADEAVLDSQKQLNDMKMQAMEKKYQTRIWNRWIYDQRKCFFI